MEPNTKRNRRSRRGYSTIVLSLSAVVLFGMLGLAVDLGRMYVAKNESQAYVDSAALSAVLELDGTTAGISRARSVVAASQNRWNFAQTAFVSPTIEFSDNPDNDWEANPTDNLDEIRFVRITSKVDQPNFFIPVAGAAMQSAVRARAVAGQKLKTYWSEGVFPFTPLARSGSFPHFGLEVGQMYTFRWPANPQRNKNVCAGDNENNIISQAEAGGGSERGYYQETSASLIRECIVGQYQFYPVYVDGTIDMTGGAKQTQRDALHELIDMDTDGNSTRYANYTGNGRRLVVMPINTYHPNYIVKGFGAFLLMPKNQYTPGGNQEWCAEYVGAWVQGSKKKAAATGGGYVARIVR